MLISHPTGNANAYQAALALEEAGLLREFWTCIAWRPNRLLRAVCPSSVSKFLNRRTPPQPLHRKCRAAPFHEIVRHLAGGLKLGSLVAGEEAPFGIDSVYRAFDARVARRLRTEKGIASVYCYEDGALETFKSAKSLGLRCIYELPIGYWKASAEIYRIETLREPDWAVTLTGASDSQEKLERKDSELALADQVIVASSFTRDTLQSANIGGKPVHVVPYGAPEFRGDLVARKPGAPLRVLFAGSLGQRKGLSYLINAVESLGSAVQLTLLGRKVVENCAPLNRAVQTYRWIPSLPHDQVLAEIEKHDVLVLPSLFEGFGLVILEAMSRGVPVIATPHTAARDLISDSIDGYIVPIASSTAIAEKLEEMIRDSERCLAMKHAARATAERYTWAAYRRSLVEAIHRSA